MTKYRLPEALGAGECDLLTPLELAQHSRRADVQVDGLGTIDVPFDCLTELKPPLPDEPSDRGYYLAVGYGDHPFVVEKQTDCWWEIAGRRKTTWPLLNEDYPGAIFVRLVPDPLSEAPELPWRDYDNAMSVSADIGCGCNGQEDGARLVRLVLSSTEAHVAPVDARRLGLALLRAATEAEASR